MIDRSTKVWEWATNHFDSRRLRVHGLKLPFDKCFSPMWLWHFLHSDMPKGLGFVAPFYVATAPWKHLSGAEPARYNALDNAITLIILNGVCDQLKKEGRWEAAQRHYLEMEEPFELMHVAGVLIDKEAQGSLATELTTEYEKRGRCFTVSSS